MTFLVNLLVGVSTLFCVGLNDPGKNPGQYQDYVLKQLNPDCYYNWAVYSENNLINSEFNPMIFRPNEGNINQAVRLSKQYPSRTWLIYNEPENADQANVTADVAATWFDRAFEAIKQADPTAKIACCGVIVSEKGVNWVKEFYAKVQNKPDYWHIHVYINSTKFTDWKAFIDYWVYWNTQFGNKKFLITETCGAEQTNQLQLMKDIFNYKNDLLDRVYWFSAYPEIVVPSWKCNLLNADGSLTDLGKTFQTLTTAPNKLTPVPEPTLKPTATAAITPTATKLPPTATPTITPTPVPTIDETTGEGGTNEPHQQKLYLPILFN